MSDAPKKPEYSCQYIDKIIKTENEIIKSLERNHYDEFEDLLGNVDDALWYRGDIETEAEKVRDINSKLRDWGEYHEERADNLEIELEQVKAKFDELLDMADKYPHRGGEFTLSRYIERLKEQENE